jgi:hypothetical protein
MRGAIPPLLQYAFMAWCLVKHKNNFTFTFYVSVSRGHYQTVGSLNLKRTHLKYVNSIVALLPHFVIFSELLLKRRKDVC